MESFSKPRRMVYALIYQDLLHSGQCVRSTAYFVKRTKLSRDTVTSVIQSLERDGFIRIETFYDKKGIRRRKISARRAND